MVASSVSVIDGLYPNLEEVQGLRSGGIRNAQLRLFITAGVWNAASLQKVLIPEADSLVGATEADRRIKLLEG